MDSEERGIRDRERQVPGVVVDERSFVARGPEVGATFVERELLF